MARDDNRIDDQAAQAARAFGAMVRTRRKALDLRQDQLALATGVGRRFVIELEAGKSSCQLGRSLLVAAALGLKPADLSAAPPDDLPDLPDALEEPDGEPAGLL